MTALTKDRATPFRTGVDTHDPVATGVNIKAGALVAFNAAGFLTPGATATGLKARGVAQAAIDNPGADGAVSCPVRKGTFRFANDGSINRGHIEGSAYIVDDQTVAATDGTGTRSAAGRIIDVEPTGVWVELA